jgi:hypothetical protein
MFHPVLTLLVAGSMHAGFDAPARADLAQIVIEITQALPVTLPAMPEAEIALTVCDVPFYYSDLTPLEAPAAPLIVTYDWRSPVIFDLP